MPRQADLGGDARQGGGVDRDLGHVVPRHTLGHGDGDEAGAALHLGLGAFDRALGQRDQPRQPVERVVHVARILARDDDAVVLFVHRERHAVAVENQPARGGDQPHVDAVLFGKRAVDLAFLDLHGAHPPAQHADHGQLRGADDEAAPSDAAGAFGGFLGRAFHAEILRRLSVGLRATPRSQRAAKATIG